MIKTLTVPRTAKTMVPVLTEQQKQNFCRRIMTAIKSIHKKNKQKTIKIHDIIIKCVVEEQ